MEITTSAIKLIIVLTVVASTYAEDELYHNNGWIPISKEKVLKNLHRNVINTPNREYSTDYWNPIVLNEENNGYVEQNTDLSPRDINRELMNKNYDIGIEDTQDQKGEIDQQQNSEAEYFDTLGIPRYSGVHPRKAKKMAENQDNENNIYVSHEEETDITKKHIKLNEEDEEKNKINEKPNNYEVIEATETSEVKDIIDMNQSNKELIDPYFKPKLETTIAKNLSNILFSILGNYNIRINDDLTNYALSRSNQNTNSAKQGYVYSAPTRNSPNHLPVDPVLAVLLSHYGYYLPGLYGFPGHYNNIYGYLASNNIHNNKPFGAYKIYSDTDSSQ